MAFPRDIGVIDLMLNVPDPNDRAWYAFLKPLLLDEQSRNFDKMPAEHLFRHIPEIAEQDDYVAYTVAQMDRFGIDKALVGISAPLNQEALRRFPDRFIGSVTADPNRGMEGVREIERAVEEWGIKAVTAFPAGLCPQVPINDKKFYPIYAKCVELDLPICPCVGVPGPRVPLGAQKVEHLDEVCWFFPELKIVMRHGGHPWEDLAVKLMLKYPNLYLMTSAYAPRHYPKAYIDYANSRGAHKVLYAGYFPRGCRSSASSTSWPESRSKTRSGLGSCAKTRWRSFRYEQDPADRRAVAGGAARRADGARECPAPHAARALSASGSRSEDSVRDRGRLPRGGVLEDAAAQALGRAGSPSEHLLRRADRHRDRLPLDRLDVRRRGRAQLAAGAVRGAGADRRVGGRPERPGQLLVRSHRQGRARRRRLPYQRPVVVQQRLGPLRLGVPGRLRCRPPRASPPDMRTFLVPKLGLRDRRRLVHHLV